MGRYVVNGLNALFLLAFLLSVAVQLNETVEKDANGNVLRRSLMINIRSNDVDEADRLYCQLKAKLNSRAVARDGSMNRAAGKDGNGNAPICQCGKPMVLRQGRRGPFYSCSAYPQCQITRDFNGTNGLDEDDADEIRLEEIQV